MRRVKSRNTAPELKVRAILRRTGIRFTYQPKTVPGRPDFARVKDKVAIFVHGCFWHGHHCPRGRRIPKTNTDYWMKKIERNRKRDRKVRRYLTRHGWRLFVVWECDLQSGVEAVARSS